MATWKQFTDDAPDLAREVRDRLTATKHHVLATLRGDGSPRVSGTEVDFFADDLVLGSMLNAVKARDLQRDPRYALHANPGDGSMDAADVKISGRATEAGPDDIAAFLDEAPETPQPFHLFRLDIDDVVLAGLNAERDAMLIRLWRPGRDVQSFERR
ncbi:pyridoxamine 5'-phosphate oxidase [Haloactinopolyspora alba]|uniref:Pyridoxamine 5'-phosphate oxidase n=1 Tax=Haloactinopolyspora alba TaxID=648780 RepID=A0A2P8E7H9_9ACTN|nr:pyridoxamine 5'-phosphate oxidase family protein [Haloactinopolyspora alba]PSL05378.1 pyridoxamine 5'-phosphate oxidase [Haloactinopolyspora alba]